MSLERWCNEVRGDWDDFGQSCELHNAEVSQDKFDDSITVEGENIGLSTNDYRISGDAIHMELEEGSMTIEKHVSGSVRIFD